MVTLNEIRGINRIIGFAAREKNKIKNERDLTTLSRSGLPRRYFQFFTGNVGIAVTDFEHLAQMPPDTINGKDDQELLSPDATERLIEVALIFVRGIEIFGSKASFRKWISTENLALGGIKPQELLDNSFGIQELNDELTRIDHGIFA
jgi:putative toxin-antitoxin system antitoxin component (TIGR02293 family)